MLSTVGEPPRAPVSIASAGCDEETWLLLAAVVLTGVGTRWTVESVVADTSGWPPPPWERLDMWDSEKNENSYIHAQYMY